MIDALHFHCVIVDWVDDWRGGGGGGTVEGARMVTRNVNEIVLLELILAC